MRLIIAVMLCLYGWAVPLAAQEYQDSDWNTVFYSNCELPQARATGTRPASVGWVKVGPDRKLRFHLQPGDKGGCSSDNGKRAGSKFRERAEVKQADTLEVDVVHDIRVVYRLLEGLQGVEETLFQVHGYTPNCGSAPLLMVGFDGGALFADALQRNKPGEKGIARKGRGIHVNLTEGRGTIAPQYNREIDLRVRLHLRAWSPELSLWWGGRQIADRVPLFMEDCAKPHVKFGLYRPGGLGSGVSDLLVDDVSISSHR